MKSDFVIGCLALFSLSAMASEKNSTTQVANKILSDLHNATKPAFIPLKSLPQNFGGEAPKIAHDKWTAVA